MASVTTLANMSLVPWDEGDDAYDRTQLTQNWVLVDQHDHTQGKGRQIPTGGIQDGAVTSLKIAFRGVTRNRIELAAVGPDELADDAVTRSKIADDAVGSEELAEASVQAGHLHPDVLPVGTILPWWRPNAAQPLPGGWVPCDGRSLSPGEHDFQGVQTFDVPDLVGRTLMGSAETGIGVTGGSNTVDVSHSHTQPGHTHTVTHNHVVPDHRHTIQVDGVHEHGWLGLDGPGPHVSTPTALGTRGAATSSGSTFQAVYLPGFNTGNNDTAFLDMNDAGSHDHGGLTGWANPITTSTENPTTSSTAPTTDTALSSIDVRGAHLQVLFIIKVKVS